MRRHKINHPMVKGVGLGFRRDIAPLIIEDTSNTIDFIELAPENWIGVGGHYKRVLNAACEKYPLFCHGLSLSIGSEEPLDFSFLSDLKQFFREYPVALYSEHLSFSKVSNAHLHELLPLPFTKRGVDHVVSRIQQVQEYLQREIAIESVSYYLSLEKEMEEHEFISEIVKRSGCNLLLDVNNVYVNSFNHGYLPKEFISSIPLEKVVYVHMAGHTKVAEELIVDTHGEALIEEVYDLLAWTLPFLNRIPILLERDFNFPEFGELLGEMNQLKKLAQSAWEVYA